MISCAACFSDLAFKIGAGDLLRRCLSMSVENDELAVELLHDARSP